MGLDAREETPARTPWWLLLLRMIAATLVILALARPVLDAGSTLAGSGTGAVGCGQRLGVGRRLAASHAGGEYRAGSRRARGAAGGAACYRAGRGRRRAAGHGAPAGRRSARQTGGAASLILGSDHPDTLRAAGALGALLTAKGNPTGAEPYLRDALERQRRTLSLRHPDTAAMLVRLGQVLNDQRQYADAESLLREALDIDQTIRYRKTDWTMSTLGESLLGQRKLAEAEPLLVEGFAAIGEKSRIHNTGKTLGA